MGFFFIQPRPILVVFDLIYWAPRTSRALLPEPLKLAQVQFSSPPFPLLFSSIPLSVIVELMLHLSPRKLVSRSQISFAEKIIFDTVNSAFPKHIRKPVTRKPFFCNLVLKIQMIRKRYQDAKAGFQLISSLKSQKFLRKIGLGKEDRYFWKQVGKSLLCTYALFGAAWVYNETSPLGWWTLKPRPKEEKELAHLYERREFPYPGDEEAMEEFIAKGGMIGTTIGPKGMVEIEDDSYNYQKELQKKKFDQESQKLWLRMRNEVISKLQEKGYDVE